MRLLSALFLAGAPLFGCSCFNSGTPFTSMSGPYVVFVGRVLVDSGEGWGTGPARVLVEEGLHNVPEGLKEVEVNTDSGSSCYYRLKEGERYVIYAEERLGAGKGYFIGGCTVTFAVRGKEQVLDAIRNQVRGGPPRIVGTVRRSDGGYVRAEPVAGATVVARSADARYEVTSNADGGYEFRGLAPGRYYLEVSKPGFLPDDEFNRRSSGLLVVNPTTGKVEGEPAELRGSVYIGEKRCGVWDLALWPNGRISGVIRDRSGAPLSGVKVQAFQLNQKLEPHFDPLRTAKTDELGHYVLEPLPGGAYVVGVSAITSHDEDPYPKTMFTRPGGPLEGSAVHLADGGEETGIDLVLPPKRVATTLQVRVQGRNGAPIEGADVKIEDRAGAQRWYAKEKTSAAGMLEVPAYEGEDYIVKAFAHDEASLGENRVYDYLGGSAQVHISGPGTTVLIVLAPRSYRDDH